MQETSSERLSEPKLLGPFALIASQVLVSGGALVLEIVAGRMLAPYVGMSVYTWTAVIAVVLAGLSVGHWVGGRVADQSPQTALARTALYLAFGALTTAAAIFALRFFAEPVSSMTSHPVLEITLLATVAFFAPSFFAGVPSPVITSLTILTYPDQQGRAIGSIFAAGAIGAILGTLASGYLLIGWLGSTATVVVVAATYLAVALLFALGSGIRRALVICIVLVLTTAGLCIAALKSLSPCTKESRYFCIRVVDLSTDVGQPARLMVLDHLGHGISVESDPDLLLMPYVSLIDILVRTKFDRPPRSAFFIGGGAYTLPRAWQSRGVKDIHVAEIDPAVTAMAVSSFWLEPSDMKIEHRDARRALAGTPQKFEAIVGDAFTDIAVPPHLVTREFFLLVRKHLADNGVYVMNFVDDADRAQALRSIKATLEAVFSDVSVYVEESDLRTGGRTTFVLLASRDPINIKTLVEEGRQSRRFINVSDANILHATNPEGQLILTDDHAPIDHLIGLSAM